MDEQSNIVGNQQTNQSHHLSRIIIIVIIVFGFISTFASGYFLGNLLSLEQDTTTGPAVTPSPTTNIPQVQQDTTKFLPGKHYFDDTIILITKSGPRITLVATVARAEQESNYIQNSRVSYFDGSTWNRKSDSKITTDSAVISNNLVKSWSVDVDPSRVLKQTAQGEITINNTSVNFSTDVLQNEIGMRSLPGYTKFMSYGNGKLIIDGQNRPAYIIYTRIYSLNASDIQFYNQPFGLTTDWIAFFDAEGNFYHIDETSVDKPTQIYQTHSIAVFEDINGGVLKSFDLNITRDSQTPPAEYSINMKAPISKALVFKRIDSINKAPDNSFTWIMGNIEGTVTAIDGKTVNGVGIAEYIHN